VFQRSTGLELFWESFCEEFGAEKEKWMRKDLGSDKWSIRRVPNGWVFTAPDGDTSVHEDPDLATCDEATSLARGIRAAFFPYFQTKYRGGLRVDVCEVGQGVEEESDESGNNDRG
jgi:hypothetical protein